MVKTVGIKSTYQVSMTHQKKPFLLQFAKETGSPDPSEMGSEYYFDPEDDLLHWKNDADNPPAIERSGESGPDTKKHDIEKGDDSKDRGIWM